MSLFVLASRDGWVNIMYTGLDAVGVDQQVCVLLLWEAGSDVNKIKFLRVRLRPRPSEVNKGNWRFNF